MPERKELLPCLSAEWVVWAVALQIFSENFFRVGIIGRFCS